MQIVELRNPNALKIVQIRELFRKAFEAVGWVELARSQAAVEQAIADQSTYILVVKDGLEYPGLAITVLPSGADKYPQVTLLYSEKGSNARKLLIPAIVDFIHKKGYNQFQAVNRSGKNDDAWIRVMKPEGWSVEPAGTIMEFKFNG